MLVVERPLEELYGPEALGRKRADKGEFRKGPRLSGTACPTRCPPEARA